MVFVNKFYTLLTIPFWVEVSIIHAQPTRFQVTDASCPYPSSKESLNCPTLRSSLYSFAGLKQQMSSTQKIVHQNTSKNRKRLICDLRSEFIQSCNQISIDQYLKSSIEFLFYSGNYLGSIKDFLMELILQGSGMVKRHYNSGEKDPVKQY